MSNSDQPESEGDQLTQYRRMMAERYGSHPQIGGESSVDPSTGSIAEDDKGDEKEEKEKLFIDDDGVPVVEGHELELWLKKKEMEAEQRLRQEVADAEMARRLQESVEAETRADDEIAIAVHNDDSDEDDEPEETEEPFLVQQKSDEDLARELQEQEWNEDRQQQPQQPHIHTQTQTQTTFTQNGPGTFIHFSQRGQRPGNSRSSAGARARARRQPFMSGWPESDPFATPANARESTDPFDYPDEEEMLTGQHNEQLNLLNMLMSHANSNSSGGSSSDPIERAFSHPLMRQLFSNMMNLNLDDDDAMESHPQAIQALQSIQNGEEPNYDGLVELEEMFGSGRQPASEDKISRLPTHVQSSSTETEERRTCVVCMSEFDGGEEVKTLECGHQFHSTCIDKWLRVSGTCPVCKNKV